MDDKIVNEQGGRSYSYSAGRKRSLHICRYDKSYQFIDYVYDNIQKKLKIVEEVRIQLEINYNDAVCTRFEQYINIK